MPWCGSTFEYLRHRLTRVYRDRGIGRPNAWRWTAVSISIFVHGMKMFREKKFESTTVVVVVFVVGAGALLCMGMCLLY